MTTQDGNSTKGILLLCGLFLAASYFGPQLLGEQAPETTAAITDIPSETIAPE